MDGKHGVQTSVHASKPTLKPLAPGAWLGVIGGGQLGRMFAQAAQRLGYRVIVLDPLRDGPAGQVADEQIVAAYDDPAALALLAQRCTACTTEFESVPAASLSSLELLGVNVSPPAEALSVCQHRAREKALFTATGVGCAPHAFIDDSASLAAASALPLFPGILKTATLGYDGKGQVAVTQPEDLAPAWAQLGRQPCLLELRLPLAFEISVVVARGRDAQVVALPPQRNVHRHGILATTQVPAPGVPPELAQQAVAQAQALAVALNYVGVLCVEFFVLSDGRLLANEMAPRPHNSGHASIDACDSSQFDAQVRCLAQLPLRTPRQHSAAVMLNLLGELWWSGAAAALHAETDPADSTPSCGPTEPPWARLLALPGTHLHLYGKAEPRPGRKMGHLTITAADLRSAQAVARQATALLGLPDDV